MHVYKITEIYTPVIQLTNTDACHIKLGNLAIMSIQRSVFKPMFSKEYRPVAGGGAGGAQAPPEIFRLELIFAIKVEFWY